jgi:hypothetical protein
VTLRIILNHLGNIRRRYKLSLLFITIISSLKPSGLRNRRDNHLGLGLCCYSKEKPLPSMASETHAQDMLQMTKAPT